MKEKQKPAAEVIKRYRAAGKKEKPVILAEFVKNTGYNKKYASRILSNYGRVCVTVTGGKPVEFKANAGSRRGGGGRKKKYGDDVFAVIRRIREFFDYQCGTLLAPLIRLMTGFLTAGSAFAITGEIKSKLMTISASTIDRGLKQERKKLEIKGKSLTKPGKLLKRHIPVRTFFARDERKPGFFEIDTVSHCGSNSYGEFCSSLTLTDVFSGWTEERGLRNRAYSRIVKATAEVKASLPFKMPGIDSDNGGEFINNSLITWCKENQVTFTRSRPYRKNDSCFVEQKNGDIVRKVVGYHRYDTEAETKAPEEVYRYFCPLNNFWYPSIKIIRKDRLPDGRIKKGYDAPKTPYQRLLESPDISLAEKNELRLRAALINPVEQKRLQNRALVKLLKINSQKLINISAPGLSGAHG